MSFNFFPRDKTFWLYHMSVLAVYSLFMLVVILTTRPQIAFNIIGNLIWLPTFTGAVLLFRYFYKTKNWHKFSTGKTIILTILYGILAGFAVTLVMLLLSVPFFWNQLFTPTALKSMNTSLAQVMTQLVVGNAFSTMIFVCAWIYIYVGTTTKIQSNKLELDNLKLQNNLKEAQLNSLSNQLNPHFLFNALNNIRFMIHENSTHADKMVTSLSDILRYSLESNKNEKVTLHQEIEIIERYIDIVRTQFEKRLTFKMDIPESLRDYLIPPMTLQMLAENAVKHGLDNIHKGGILAIAATENGDSIVLSVINDLPKSKINSNENIGIGLQNIDQRLRLLYGTQASFTQTKTDSQFIAEVRLPKETEQ